MRIASNHSIPSALMMVSSRLSLCTRTPVGRTPMMATRAMAMTPRQSAISTIVKAAVVRRDTVGVVHDSCLFVFIRGGSLEFRPDRLIDAGAAGQPVDANEVVGVIVRRLDHHVGRGGSQLALAVFRVKDAALGQWNQFVVARLELALRVEGDIGERPFRAFSVGKRKLIRGKGPLVIEEKRGQ